MKDERTGLSTCSIHAGTVDDTIGFGVNTPIFTSSVTKFPNESDEMLYPRYSNTPTQRAVASKVAALEGAEAGLVYSSGMAAISCALLTFLKQGDHAVFQSGLYGGTQQFAQTELPKAGIEATVVPSLDIHDFAKAIKPNTKVMYIESPTNPLLDVIDIQEIAKLAKAHNLVTIIDNTFASPINQNPIALGIDIVMHSGTKYLNGHSDLVCGALVGSREKIEKLHKTAYLYGGQLPPQVCYLLERGMKTLAIRVAVQNANAMKLATFLSEHPQVKRVNYPGLSTHPTHKTAAKQMRGFGGMMSFELDADSETTVAFMNSLSLVTPAVSLGGVETIVCRPCETSHAKLSTADREKQGIRDSLIRLSVGIEDFDDLKSDFEQALTTIAKTVSKR